MKTIELDTLIDILEMIRGGNIRPEHIAALRNNPDALLHSAWHEALVCLTPRDAKRITHFRMSKRGALYTAMRVIGQHRSTILYLNGAFQCAFDGDDVIGNFTIAEDLPLFSKHSIGISFIYHGTMRFAQTKPNVSQLSLCKGKPLYVASSGRGKQMVMWGERFIAEHDCVWDLQAAGGFPLYACWDEIPNTSPPKREYKVVRYRYDKNLEMMDLEFLKRPLWSNNVRNLLCVDGNIVWIEETPEGECVCQPGKRGGPYEKIAALTLDNRGPLYAGLKNGVWILEFPHGARRIDVIPGEGDVLYIDPTPRADVSHTPKVLITQRQPNTIRVTGGEDIPLPGKLTGVIGICKNMPVCTVEIDGRSAVMYGKELSKQYDEICDVRIEDGMIKFGARKGRKIYRVSRLI